MVDSKDCALAGVVALRAGRAQENKPVCFVVPCCAERNGSWNWLWGGTDPQQGRQTDRLGLRAVCWGSSAPKGQTVQTSTKRSSCRVLDRLSSHELVTTHFIHLLYPPPPPRPPYPPRKRPPPYPPRPPPPPPYPPRPPPPYPPRPPPPLMYPRPPPP